MITLHLLLGSEKAEIVNLRFPLLYLEITEINEELLSKQNYYFLEKNMYAFRILTHDLKTPINCVLNLQ